MAAGLAIAHGRTEDAELVGRDPEVAEIEAFLEATAGAPAALVIVGDVGIGKTSVWRHALRAASRRHRVLACRPARAEAPLAFAALDDLFGGVLDEILPALPAARGRALALALRGWHGEPAAGGPVPGGRAGPGHGGHLRPEPRVLARAVLDGLRLLSSNTPVLVAVDDAQWLDGPSAAALEFCVRRLEQAAVSILLTLRGDDPVFPLGLDQALSPGSLACTQLGGLGPAAIAAILRARLGVTFPRSTLRRLYDACGGNPLYALESGRALLERGRACAAGEPIPIPPGISDLVRPRLRGLSPDALRVGRLIAASADPREHVIRAASSDQESRAAMDQVIDGGLIRRDSDALRFTHPLLGPVLYAEMTMSERRDVHRRLAASAVDIEDRAWHLALAAEEPNEQIAALLDAAAGNAAARGAPEAAAVLAEQAMRMTPARPADAGPARMLRAADYHFRAGEIGRSRELVDNALTGCPPGSRRAALLIRQAAICYHQSGWARAERLFHQAIREAAGDTELRAHAEAELAQARLAAGDLPAARRWAGVALRSAEQAGRPRLLAHALARLAVVEFLRGGPVRTDLLDLAGQLDEDGDGCWAGGSDRGERGEPAEGGGSAADHAPDRVAAMSGAAADGGQAGDRDAAAPGAAGDHDANGSGEAVEYLALSGPALLYGAILKWSDRLDQARRRFARCHRRALDRGDDASLPFLLAHLSELECWAGNWDAAAEYAREGCTVASDSHQLAMRPAPLYALALARAHQGHTDKAHDLATEALTLCERSGNLALGLGVRSVLGFIAVSLGDYPAAHAHLGGLAAGAGLDQPSVVKFLPDEIEALAALGETGLAHACTARLHARGSALDRPWALATAARCRAHLAGMAGDHVGARSACAAALAAHERLPMPFELGRTLLIKGITERRARRKSAAGESFGQALAIFERLGATLWAVKARRELATIAPRPNTSGLTQTQQRVAALIAQGQTNREIATALFVTVNTVQTHVRHIFQKLGVRSRTELAAMLLGTSPHADSFLPGGSNGGTAG